MRPLLVEILETRNLPSGSPLAQFFLDGTIAGNGSSDVSSLPGDSAGQLTGRSQAGGVSSTLVADASGRWDWLAGTVWYVPAPNMLAYTFTPSLTDPTPVADQTVWFINQSAGGQFSGEAVIHLSSEPTQTRMLSGIITPDGQVRITFTSSDPNAAPTIGVGQTRFVDGQLRIEMQMASGSSSLIAHWAYQSQLGAGMTPPDAAATVPDQGQIDTNWNWLLGTHWALVDKTLLGSNTPGIFTINAYDNGYFWGSGSGAQPFNVAGSITPEGNVLLLASVNGGPATSQAGFLFPTAAGGIMTLRSYEGAAGTGLAWTVPTSVVDVSGISLPTNLATFSTSGQGSIQSLGQNALPATDVPGTWQATGSLTNAVPWALIDGNFTALGGATRVESLESTALGIFAPLARAGHGVAVQQSLLHPRDADQDDTHSANAPEELPEPSEKRLLR